MSDVNTIPAKREAAVNAEDPRERYESPRLTKKRSVARVTLFSGSGASGASGLTSA
jgi:hypothetical protein